MAGERFRTLLQDATKTPLRGALAGAAVTAAQKLVEKEIVLFTGRRVL